MTTAPRIIVAPLTRVVDWSMTMQPYYEDNKAGITIYHGDCRAIVPCLPAADHVITDPPYSDRTHTGARTNPDWTISGGNEPPVLLDFSSISIAELKTIYTLCAPRRWLISFCDWRYIGPLEQAPPDKLRFVRFGVWVKPNGAPQFSGDRPATGWEAVAIMHNIGGGRMRWNGGGLPAVWTYHLAPIGAGRGHSEHRTTKPIPLLRDLVQKFTDTGDLVLDPFAGIGSTALACKDLGRRCTSIEKEERYCEIMARKLSQEVMDLSL
jgi:site-specific DNA-methyltransferase (adenine-specific)